MSPELMSPELKSGDLKDGDPIECYEPYLLSSETRQKPTRFEIEFYVKSVRYTYCVEYNRKDITFEKLDFYPGTRVANIFTRTSQNDWKSVKFGERYKGGKKQIPFFSNNTYLSKAGNTPDSPDIIRKIYNFFRKNTHTMLANHSITVPGWDKNNKIVSIVNTFLNKVDLGINKFGIEIGDSLNHFEFPEDIPEKFKLQIKRELSKKTYFYHPDKSGELIRFEEDKESRGTNKLFKLLPLFIGILNDGKVLFVDEIEGSLHPHVAELLVKLFNDPLVNKRNAQLIFTTHSLTLMDSKTMRKDQIYLADKSIENGTQLHCLENYEVALKDNSPFAKWYEEGRLGSIPKLNYRDISDSIKELF